MLLNKKPQHCSGGFACGSATTTGGKDKGILFKIRTHPVNFCISPIANLL